MEDPETPLGELPAVEEPQQPEHIDDSQPENEVIIIDSDVPLGNLPQTGTQVDVGTGFIGGLAIIIVLFAGLGAAFIKREDE